MTFFEIFVSVIASAGGLGAILWISIKSVSKYLVEDLNKKYQLQLDKQLEEYKKTLDIEKSVHNSMLSNKVFGSGENNHSRSIENNQFQSNKNNQSKIRKRSQPSLGM